MQFQNSLQNWKEQKVFKACVLVPAQQEPPPKWESGDGDCLVIFVNLVMGIINEFLVIFTIMAVLAVLLIHIESSAVGSINPRSTFTKQRKIEMESILLSILFINALLGTRKTMLGVEPTRRRTLRPILRCRLHSSTAHCIHWAVR